MISILETSITLLKLSKLALKWTFFAKERKLDSFAGKVKHTPSCAIGTERPFVESVRLHVYLVSPIAASFKQKRWPRAESRLLYNA